MATPDQQYRQLPMEALFSSPLEARAAADGTSNLEAAFNMIWEQIEPLEPGAGMQIVKGLIKLWPQRFPKEISARRAHELVEIIDDILVEGRP
jgi:hypothetical protein